MRTGRVWDEERLALVRRLRADGWTWKAIGERFGVSGSCVVYYAGPRNMYRSPLAGRRFVCRGCGASVPSPAAQPRYDGHALCLPCLEKTPDATFAEALRAYRLAAGLGLAELARRAGVGQPVVYRCDEGIGRPSAGTLAKLVKAMPKLRRFANQAKGRHEGAG